MVWAARARGTIRMVEGEERRVNWEGKSKVQSPRRLSSNWPLRFPSESGALRQHGRGPSSDLVASRLQARPEPRSVRHNAIPETALYHRFTLSPEGSAREARVISTGVFHGMLCSLRNGARNHWLCRRSAGILCFELPPGERSTRGRPAHGCRAEVQSPQGRAGPRIRTPRILSCGHRL